MALEPLAPLLPLEPLMGLEMWPALEATVPEFPVLAPVPHMAMALDEARAHLSLTEVREWEHELELRLDQARAPRAWQDARPMRAAVTMTSDEDRPEVRYHQGDPADSLYKQAHELLRRGEYRRAATIFRELPAKFPSSAYQADALYWQAFALYRIGGTADLRSALEALDQHRAKYPGARNRTDAAGLTTRITGALAARGDPAAANKLRDAATDSAYRCDSEEQQVRAAALNALSQSDPDNVMQLLERTLARKDECTATLRRTAVYLVGNNRVGNSRRDPAAVTLLSQVARSDPSYEVRASALQWLARIPSDEALSVLEALSRDTADERIQRTAIRALVSNPSPRARTYVRSVIERPETPERLRFEAIGAFDKERSTADDATWLRALYSRTNDTRMKSRIVQTLANIGGDDVDQWMLTLARNADESSDTRRYALRRVARTLPIVDLARLYDTAAERPLRESLIEALATRPEAEATDKLIDIVKTGTDPRLRQQAINALTRKKDPRSTRLLMEIIDK
jgi:HEAT repeat protein